MSHTDQYAIARRRAKAKYGFFVHATVYAAVMVLLVIVNLLTSPGNIWFIWPLIGWGVAVTLMGAVVFGQSLDGYAYLGVGLILAGTIVLNGLSSAASV